MLSEVFLDLAPVPGRLAARLAHLVELGDEPRWNAVVVPLREFRAMSSPPLSDGPDEPPD